MKTHRNSLGIAGLAFAGLVTWLTALLLAPGSPAQTPGDAQKSLETKVHYTTTQASVQDIVQNLAEQAGLKYDRRKSFAQTDPVCRQWVRDLTIESKPCREALDQVLKPVGLRYQLENGAVVLSRVTPSSSSAATAASTGGSGEQKLEAARAALRGEQKDTARAQKLLREILDQDRSTLKPGSLCYVYVYLGYIDDRAGKRKQAIDWFKQALKTRDADRWIRQCAEAGLTEPLTWIRHLDEGTPPTRSALPSNKQASGKGYVTTAQPPT